MLITPERKVPQRSDASQNDHKRKGYPAKTISDCIRLFIRLFKIGLNSPNPDHLDASHLDLDLDNEIQPFEAIRIRAGNAHLWNFGPNDTNRSSWMCPTEIKPRSSEIQPKPEMPDLRPFGQLSTHTHLQARIG